MYATATTTLALLQATFTGKINLNSADVGLACGLTPASIRTLRSRGQFNLASTSNGGKHTYDIRDVADFIDSRRPQGHKKRGRKTKIQRAAAAAAGRASC